MSKHPTGARTIRRSLREATWQAAADILSDVAKEYRCDIMAMRAKPFPEKVKRARIEFMNRANAILGYNAIADMLHCDESTVRYYVSPKYREWKRTANVARDARSRASARENIRPD